MTIWLTGVGTFAMVFRMLTIVDTVADELWICVLLLTTAWFRAITNCGNVCWVKLWKNRTNKILALYGSLLLQISAVCLLRHTVVRQVKILVLLLNASKVIVSHCISKYLQNGIDFDCKHWNTPDYLKLLLVGKMFGEEFSIWLFCWLCRLLAFITCASLTIQKTC